jgi:hypothetical protein
LQKLRDALKCHAASMLKKVPAGPGNERTTKMSSHTPRMLGRRDAIGLSGDDEDATRVDARRSVKRADQAVRLFERSVVLRQAVTPLVARLLYGKVGEAG